jgi:GH25 family lysozyme M1 (1,4-beta-N-acetylmuramidase)
MRVHFFSSFASNYRLFINTPMTLPNPQPTEFIPFPSNTPTPIPHHTANVHHQAPPPPPVKPPPHLPTRETTINKPLVIDIYHGDPVVDFNLTKASGIIGVIHKATQGGQSWDQEYSSRRKLATAAGLLWGAYHFFDFSASPQVQADHFLSVAAPDSNTLVCLDWENIGNKEPSAALAHAFLQEIEAKLGRKAVIYSGNVAKEQLNDADPYFGSHRLWLCQYGSAWRVQVSWQYPWLWQNNGDSFGPGPHAIPGIKGLVDNNTIVDPITVDLLKEQWAS